MQIQITGRHLDITPAIREYAEDKTAKLTRYFDRISQIEVIAKKPDQRTFEVEMIAHIDNHDHIVADSNGEDLYACIDDTINKMERQLTDHKEKLRNRKHPAHR